MSHLLNKEGMTPFMTPMTPFLVPFMTPLTPFLAPFMAPMTPLTPLTPVQLMKMKMFRSGK